MSAPKTAFFCGPGDGEKLFDPGASRHKGQECLRAIRTEKFMFMLVFSSKPKGPGEKGAPRNHPDISSQKLADFECIFPYDSYGRDNHFGPFWEKDFGAISGGPFLSQPLWFTAEFWARLNMG